MAAFLPDCRKIENLINNNADNIKLIIILSICFLRYLLKNSNFNLGYYLTIGINIYNCVNETQGIYHLIRRHANCLIHAVSVTCAMCFFVSQRTPASIYILFTGVYLRGSFFCTCFYCSTY